MEVLTALKSIGIEEGLAVQAAAALQAKSKSIEDRLDAIESDIRVIKWMMATLIATNIAILVKIYF